VNQTPLDLAIEGIRQYLPAFRDEATKAASDGDLFRAARLHEIALDVTESINLACIVAAEDKARRAVAP